MRVAVGLRAEAQPCAVMRLPPRATALLWSKPYEASVSVAKPTEWRERALASAASALKEREPDDREDEIARLKSKVGEITMDNELLPAKIAAMEAKSPLARRRSRR
jgi:hypothetical protein